MPASEEWATVESQGALVRELWGAKKLAVRSQLPNGDVGTVVFHLAECMSTPVSAILGGGVEQCAATGSALWDEREPTDQVDVSTTTDGLTATTIP